MIRRKNNVPEGAPLRGGEVNRVAHVEKRHKGNPKRLGKTSVVRGKDAFNYPSSRVTTKRARREETDNGKAHQLKKTNPILLRKIDSWNNNVRDSDDEENHWPSEGCFSVTAKNKCPNSDDDDCGQSECGVEDSTISLEAKPPWLRRDSVTAKKNVQSATTMTVAKVSVGLRTRQYHSKQIPREKEKLFPQK